jgi:hypothetical protein
MESLSPGGTVTFNARGTSDIKGDWDEFLEEVWDLSGPIQIVKSRAEEDAGHP